MTKKIYLMLILAIAGIASMSAQTAPRVFASELSAVQVTPGKCTLTFTLNTAATDVSIILTAPGGATTTIDAGALPAGINTVTVDSTQVSAIGTYTWAVEPTAAAVTGTEPTQYTSNANPLLNFYSGQGMAIDNNPASPYFGRIYATANYGTGGGVRVTSPGVYVLNAALTDITNQGATPYTGGVHWVVGSFNSPENCSVAADGKLYISDWSDANSNAWVMDPANPSAAFSPVFAGTKATSGMYTYNGTDIGGSTMGIYAMGGGDTTLLFTTDEDYMTAPLTANYNVLQYSVGTLPVTTAPTVAFDNGGNGHLIWSTPQTLASDGHGGIWICQLRNADASGAPVLMHLIPVSLFPGMPPTWVLYYNSADAGLLNGGTARGIMATSADGSMLALNTGVKGEVKVFSVAYAADGTPTLTPLYDFTVLNTAGAAINLNALSFDGAGNLFVYTQETVLQGYAMPTATNTFTTPAISTVSFASLPTGIKNVTASGLQVYPNPVQDVAHVTCGVAIASVKLVDLNGQLVMAIPAEGQTAMDINLSGVPAGNYVLVVNGAPVKIVKK